MKRILVFAAVCLFPVLLSAQDNTHQRFVHEGEFANVSGNISSTASFSLSVSRTKDTGSGAAASLQFSTFSETPTDIAFDNVFGPIPASAFTGTNTQNLALNIDTTTLDPTVFFAEHCDLSLVTFVFTCTQGQPAGVISLQFRENDAQSDQINLHETKQNGPVTTRIFQRSDTSTADVQGTIFGTSVSSASAQVGVNHNSTLEIIRN